MLGKLPVPGRPTNLEYSRARAYCACSRCGWGLFGHFSLLYHFSFLSPSLWETARYRLKYCLKGPLSPKQPGRVAQSVGHLTRKSGVLGSIPGLATYFRFSFRFFKKAVVSYWRKYVHEVLVNRLGGLSLPRKSVVRLTDRPDMTLDVYRGRKTTIQPTNQPPP